MPLGRIAITLTCLKMEIAQVPIPLLKWELQKVWLQMPPCETVPLDP